MTIEQYQRTITIYHQLKDLMLAEKYLRPPYSDKYEIKLSFIERKKLCGPDNWNINNHMDGIQDILDKHEKMIRQEIEDKIKMLNQEIEKL